MNEMTTSKRRRQFSAEERERWIGLYERSGQSVREFCRGHGVRQSNLARWLRQKRGVGTGKDREGTLVEVKVAPAAMTSIAARVHLRGGVMMEVASGTI